MSFSDQVPYVVCRNPCAEISAIKLSFAGRSPAIIMNAIVIDVFDEIVLTLLETRHFRAAPLGFLAATRIGRRLSSKKLPRHIVLIIEYLLWLAAWERRNEDSTNDSGSVQLAVVWKHHQIFSQFHFDR